MLKARAQSADGEEKVLARVNPLRTVLSNRPAGNHTVQVKVGPELLIPGVQHDAETELAAEVVSPEGQECVGGGAKQEVQERAAVALAGQDERIQFIWQRKHVVEVRRRQQFPLAILDPGRFGQGLAFGRMPVAAAVLQMPLVATALAPFSATA